ncbi:MAG: formylmethanofuran dehydrogenase [Candidatus Eisenbacteria sp.]|nr:formylmethanofuran dehydrogenase [Candidatus Eisenbacteria bacterium]
MVDPLLDELLDRCVSYHGHLCMGQPLGVRLALKGMELISTRDPRQMIVLIENDRCIADAIQIVTGTRIGRRSAKLVDLGKMAATFVHTETGLAYRVNVRRVDANATHGEDACRSILRVPDAELLSWRRVCVHLKPEELPGKPKKTVRCTLCGEKVFDGKEVQGAAGPLCRSCAEKPYYREPTMEEE